MTTPSQLAAQWRADAASTPVTSEWETLRRCADELDELSPISGDVEILVTQRGFQRYDEPWLDAYGQTIGVYESSAASAPHVWVSIEGSRDMQNEGVRVAAHLNVEHAKKLRRELSAFIDQAESDQ